MKKYHFVCLSLVLMVMSCNNPMKDADFIVTNALVYTCNDTFDTASAFAVSDGKFLAVGTQEDITARYTSQHIIDAEGMAVYPGFIDAHAHFTGYGLNLLTYADLSDAQDYGHLLELLKQHALKNPEGWIQGRGWDQNKWPGAQFPDRSGLDSLFPDRPVYLIRIDGHAALVNDAALKAAGITTATRVTGGSIEVRKGQTTGILIDNAMELVRSIIPPAGESTCVNALLKAQENCFAVGLTTVTDAGLPYEGIMRIDSLQQAGALKMGVYAMLEPDSNNLTHFGKSGIYITPRLSVRAVKLYADGALGSRGACMLAPYSDSGSHYGLMVNTVDYLTDICRWASEKGFQVCTHAIGDSANRTILHIYAALLKGPNDLRWRIEHAQVVHPADFGTFAAYNIIPSVQGTHATSDMYWAEKRIGAERLRGAYALKTLLKQNGWLCNGTDFPIENISPLLTFYASTVRKDLNGFPAGGFMPGEALSRREALLSMTIWAARATFLENQKGSIEAGKQADFVILDKDIMTIADEALPETRVLQTFVMGEKTFEQKTGPSQN